MAASRTAPRRLCVIGGGFTGAVLALNAIRTGAGPLDIVVVEPCADLGLGLAYGTDDRAHRINVPSDRMGLFQDDPTAATRWLFERGILPDPTSDDGTGQWYVPRAAYGAFVSSTLAEALEAAGDRVSIRHLRRSVVDVTRHDGGWKVDLADGDGIDADGIDADVVALCFGHAVPSLPCPIGDAVRRDPRFVPDPWARDAFAAIEPKDEVLIVGSGLTMADVAVGLRGRGHRGRLTAVSRRGLLPRPHGVFRGDVDFFRDNPVPTTALGLLRMVRRRIREDGAALGGWQAVIDALRFQLPRAWGSLPRTAKAQVVRRLLPFWDVHRFRVAPQVAGVLGRDVEAGTLRVERGAVLGLARDRGRFLARLRRPGGATEERSFDAVILCTGPEKDLKRNPLIARLLARGTARLDDVAIGLAVDAGSRVIDRNGRASPTLLALGPLTRGCFGEMTGAPDIAKHIEKLSSHLFDDVEDARTPA